MNLTNLINYASDKQRFKNIENYIDFCASYLDFVQEGLQARIVSQNEIHYQFYQYKEDANFNITRPINTKLMYDLDSFEAASKQFLQTLDLIGNHERPDDSFRSVIVRTIYSIQQSIGAALDALPSGRSNQARKVNGDLFERLIQLLIVRLNIDCVSGTMQVPIKDNDGTELFKMGYQHDLLISKDGELKVIGSVKTSSKDRIDKIFMDKFMYNKLTDTALPHIAIFLNDVQRKNTNRENEYGISATFLQGHFKAYTIKLNPLDGVYYCDIRPNMVEDDLLSAYIQTIDYLFYDDLWSLLGQHGQPLTKVAIKKE